MAAHYSDDQARFIRDGRVRRLGRRDDHALVEGRRPDERPIPATLDSVTSIVDLAGEKRCCRIRRGWRSERFSLPARVR
jgi:hypothetical protein